MAVRASPDQVGADMRPADFRGAVQRLRGIKAKKEKIGSVNGEIADIYAKVEGLKVNKKAARIFLTLDALEHEERVDIMRSIQGLVDSAGWDAGNDLVDEAEGKDTVVAFPQGPSAAKRGRPRKAAATENAAGEDTEIDQTMTEVENMPSENRLPASEVAANARDRARAQFGGVATDPRSAPYTGDNSDLTGE